MNTIELNGTYVSVEEAGAGDPVVFLHSSASSNKQWQAAFRALRDQFHLLAPDLYGSGGTGHWPGSGTPTLADEVALVNAVVSKLNRPVHLIGHSYGGAVALRMALQNPEWVQSLCVIEPVAFNILRTGTKEERDLFAEVLAVAQNIEQAIDAGLPLVAAQRFVDYWNGDGTWHGLHCVQRIKLSLNASKLSGDFNATFNEPTPISAYGRIDVPTLVLSGTQSPRPTRHITRMLAEIIPDARHRTIGDTGHMLPVTHPIKVNSAIRAHLMRATPMQRAA